MLQSVGDGCRLAIIQRVLRSTGDQRREVAYACGAQVDDGHLPAGDEFGELVCVLAALASPALDLCLNFARHPQWTAQRT